MEAICKECGVHGVTESSSIDDDEEYEYICVNCMNKSDEEVSSNCSTLSSVLDDDDDERNTKSFFPDDSNLQAKHSKINSLSQAFSSNQEMSVLTHNSFISPPANIFMDTERINNENFRSMVASHDVKSSSANSENYLKPLDLTLEAEKLKQVNECETGAKRKDNVNNPDTRFPFDKVRKHFALPDEVHPPGKEAPHTAYKKSFRPGTPPPTSEWNSAGPQIDCKTLGFVLKSEKLKLLNECGSDVEKEADKCNLDARFQFNKVKNLLSLQDLFRKTSKSKISPCSSPFTLKDKIVSPLSEVTKAEKSAVYSEHIKYIKFGSTTDKGIITPLPLKSENVISQTRFKLPSLAFEAENLKPINKNDSDSQRDENENNSAAKFQSNKFSRCFVTPTSVGHIVKPDLSSFSSISTSADKDASSSFTCAFGNNYFRPTKITFDRFASKIPFLFGQSIYERVLKQDSGNEHTSVSERDNLTFENITLKENDQNKFEQNTKEEFSKHISIGCSKEYECTQVKRKFDDVAPFTKEENDVDVLQVHCSLFALNKENNNWELRGRGIFYLNDRKENKSLHSFIRFHDRFQILLKARVWSEMSVVQINERCVQFTSIDHQGKNTFLVESEPKDADTLYNALNWRIYKLTCNTKKVNTTTDDKVSRFFNNDVNSNAANKTLSSSKNNVSPTTVAASSYPTLLDVSDTHKFVSFFDSSNTDRFTEVDAPSPHISPESKTADRINKNLESQDLDL